MNYATNKDFMCFTQIVDWVICKYMKWPNVEDQVGIDPGSSREIILE